MVCGQIYQTRLAGIGFSPISDGTLAQLGGSVAWEIAYGHLGGPLDPRNPNPVGMTIETRETEEEVLAYALSLIHRGIGVRWLWEQDAPSPKYEADALVAMANAKLSGAVTGEAGL